jgi:choice-of-anchor A domain-containing protein
VSSFLFLGFSATRAEAASYLYAASQYNVFVQNSLTFGGPDSVGAMAAGGNMTLSKSVSVGSGYLSANFPYYTVVAGGTLACPDTCGEIKGNMYAGAESGTIYDNTAGHVNTIGGTSPIDFSDNFTELKGLSTWLTGRATTAGDGCAYDTNSTTLTCTANAAGMNVINIPATGTVNASLLTGNLVFSIASGATLVINVDGSVSNILGGASHGFSVTDNQKLLFNYSSNTPIVNLGGTVDGSLLAPYSNVTVTTGISGQFTGNLIAQSYSGTGIEFENDLFNGEIPEPGTFAMLGGGALLLLAARRRAQRQR